MALDKFVHSVLSVQLDTIEMQAVQQRFFCDFTRSGEIICHLIGIHFFITDGKPVPYWMLPHLVFRQMGFDGEGSIVVLPKWLCLILAFFSELWARWVTGGLPGFPRFRAILWH